MLPPGDRPTAHPSSAILSYPMGGMPADNNPSQHTDRKQMKKV